MKKIKKICTTSALYVLILLGIRTFLWWGNRPIISRYSINLIPFRAIRFWITQSINSASLNRIVLSFFMFVPLAIILAIFTNNDEDKRLAFIVLPLSVILYSLVGLVMKVTTFEIDMILIRVIVSLIAFCVVTSFEERNLSIRRKTN